MQSKIVFYTEISIQYIFSQVNKLDSAWFLSLLYLLISFGDCLRGNSMKIFNNNLMNKARVTDFCLLIKTMLYLVYKGSKGKIFSVVVSFLINVIYALHVHVCIHVL